MSIIAYMRIFSVVHIGAYILHIYSTYLYIRGIYLHISFCLYLRIVCMFCILKWHVLAILFVCILVHLWSIDMT